MDAREGVRRQPPLELLTFVEADWPGRTSRERFDAFRQADETSSVQGGVGLGLSIARELVEAHDGEIRAESEGASRGSTFIVTLPLAAARRA